MRDKFNIFSRVYRPRNTDVLQYTVIQYYGILISQKKNRRQNHRANANIYVIPYVKWFTIYPQIIKINLVRNWIRN